MYFHTTDQQTLEMLESYIGNALHDGRSVRFDVDGNGSLKVKLGEGMWSAPIRSTPDPYRD